MTPEADDRTPGPSEHTASDSSGALPPTANPYARTCASGPFTVVEVFGEIDMATAGSLCEHLDAATSHPGPDVLVDLRRVAFFDCSGLRELCRADSRARERGGRLRVVSDTPRLHRLLHASGLLDRFPPLTRIPESE
ncbi:STAS domain-containing protein [Streptomyces sp. NBC_00576]|uniref:STAS domain-containing protein n=1 Tax=Streptomyces sp. NBC_00576 TaxID=2903665 RepID=UPI002E7FE0D2|nr:STAS domain-containing protein [Streptomyces sp. NBC_00576]WUB69237.1 STAS domain-containing protein [Streptomyces sp. NBC_00576]